MVVETTYEHPLVRQLAKYSCQEDVRNHIIGIMKEMQEQLPKKGLVLLRGPKEAKLKLTRKGPIFGDQPSAYPPCENVAYFNALRLMAEQYGDPEKDFYEKTEKIVKFLDDVAKKNRIRLTGKYSPR